MILQNGFYSIRLSAPGYSALSHTFLFNCSRSNCSNCPQAHALNLSQIFCEDTYFKIVVTDTGRPLIGAQVTFMTASPALPAHLDTKFTSQEGIVSFPIGGRSSYLVNITKEGFIGFAHELDIFCSDGITCADCMPRLEVELMEDGCNRTVKIVVEVSDPEDRPVVGASVTIKLKHHQVVYLSPYILEYMYFLMSSCSDGPAHFASLQSYTVLVRLPTRASASGRQCTPPTALAWLRSRSQIHSIPCYWPLANFILILSGVAVWCLLDPRDCRRFYSHDKGH